MIKWVTYKITYHSNLHYNNNFLTIDNVTASTIQIFNCRYEGVVLRSILAVIDHNHHLNRRQAKNQQGNLVYSRRWSKRAKRWKVVLVKEKKNYSYFPLLCANVLKALGSGSSQPMIYENDPKNIAPTIAALPPPPTSQLVEEHLSRF